VFRQGLRSYRELPLRLAEFGKVHRYDHRAPCTADAGPRLHPGRRPYLCTPDQITDEAVKVTQLILSIYADFGSRCAHQVLRPAGEAGGFGRDLGQGRVGAAPGRRRGRHRNHAQSGRGAFYGPSSSSCCGMRLGAIGSAARCRWTSISRTPGGGLCAEDGQKHIPVMLHRRCSGLWSGLSGFCSSTMPAIARMAGSGAGRSDGNYRPPGQILLEVAENLRNQGLRVETDLRYER